MLSVTKKQLSCAGVMLFLVAPIASQAADTPVSVTNTTANPVPSVITNSSTNLINTKVWNTVSVKVGNTATTPVPTKAVDDPALAPGQYEISWFSGTSGGFNETASTTIPAGKQYVIEGISCMAYAPSSTEVIIKLTTSAGGSTMTHYITGFKASAIYGNYHILGFTPVKIYANAGTTITVDVVRQTPPGTSTGYYSDVMLSGHFVATP